MSPDAVMMLEGRWGRARGRERMSLFPGTQERPTVTLPSSNGLLRHNSWPLALFAAAILIRLSLFVLIARYYPAIFLKTRFPLP